MDHFKNLFEFLKSFNKLKRRPQLNIKSYEEVIWFYDLPKEKECYSITYHMDSEKVHFDKWIEIKKPKRNPCPKPPEKIEPWLKGNKYDKHTEEPQLLKYRIQDPPTNFRETTYENMEADRVLLEDHPEIKQIFENYLNQKWIPWALEEKRLESVLETYNRLYKIYNTQSFQGEVYELVLGLGFLSTKNEKGSDIRRHIVTTPVFIDFNSTTGTLTVGPGEQAVGLSLEMDMLRDSERPKNCDEINQQLSDLNNDFWVKEEFDNNLKSWLNSYDPNGQFFKDFENPSYEFSTTITVSPAIILRKRNERDFLKFYDSVIKDIERKKENLDRPCLYNLIDKNTVQSQETKDNSESGSLVGKHYFPLPANEEQKKIIKKIANNNQIIVQGPPGTGKTHSIANLISHFLAEGKKVLVTSQTDRALKVLKDKLPEKIKPLCIEVLGKDQKSFQEMKNSFQAINSEYQNQDPDRLHKTIKALEQKDDEIKGELATIETRFIEIRKSETKTFDKLFGCYSGTPSFIACCLKNEEEKYKWIRENFSPKDFQKECPVSNDEAVSFLNLFKNIIDDSVFEESIEFSEQIQTALQQFEEIIQNEKEAKTFVEEHKTLKTAQRVADYKNLTNDDLKKLSENYDSLHSTVGSLLNRDEKWVNKSLEDCLFDKDRQWRYLYTETNRILSENKDAFKEADKVYTIEINLPPSTPKEGSDLYLTNLLRDFFKKYSPNDNITGFFQGFFCRTIKKLRKIKMDGSPISSYKEAQDLENYVKAKKVSKKLNKLWIDQGVDITKTQNSNFQRDYHIFYDRCEPLRDCLSIHSWLENVREILSRNNISQPRWTSNSFKEETEKIDFVLRENSLKGLANDFEIIKSSLKPYKDQKNQIAKKIISSIENRSLEEYKKALDSINLFQSQKRSFDKLCEIRKKLNNNDTFYQKLKMEAGNPVWEDRLKHFKEAWVWQKANQWFKEQTCEEFSQKLNQKREDLLKNQKQNMEKLASKKAWSSCLSQITADELSSLKGWMQAIGKIGKGTGKTASKHRKVAKKRMEECKTAIPAWIMPLYRVVENIDPTSKPFDIVIIDEASQTGPDGFLLNYLAKKIIIVGDKEQISPDNIGINDDDVEILKKKYLSGIKFSDFIGRDYSYYDYCEILFTKSHIQLREHFRCMPEIIQFSNRISYSGTPLIPMRQYGSSRLEPLKRVFIPDAISKVGKDPQNQKEAQAILDQIQKCIDNPAYDGKTFGIISLQGKAQVKVIEKLLSQQIDIKEIEERSIHVGDAYDFQGDERDVIFLSMAVAKDRNFRALTKDSEKRRYNVAASRTKDQMWLFHSIEINDLNNPEGFRRQLLDHFMTDPESMTVWPNEKLQELYKKIKETKNKRPENAPEPFDSWFEARVFLEIAMKGYWVTPQYKELGFSIDMIISGSEGRLAVECDGDYFHPEEKLEEDLERQWKLERCGWTFHRIRGSAFHREKEEALKSLWNQLNKMEINPLGSMDHFTRHS